MALNVYLHVVNVMDQVALMHPKDRKIQENQTTLRKWDSQKWPRIVANQKHYNNPGPFCTEFDVICILCTNIRITWQFKVILRILLLITRHRFDCTTIFTKFPNFGKFFQILANFGKFFQIFYKNKIISINKDLTALKHWFAPHNVTIAVILHPLWCSWASLLR